MYETDPYTPSESRYECVDCLNRMTTEESVGSCPSCGGRLKNLAIPRE